MHNEHTQLFYVFRLNYKLGQNNVGKWIVFWVSL